MYTIPLKEYYEELKEGVSIQKIAAEMAHFYQSIDSYEIAQLGNFDQLREKVIYRIVNQEKKQVFLRSVPYMPIFRSGNYISCAYRQQRFWLRSAYNQQSASEILGD